MKLRHAVALALVGLYRCEQLGPQARCLAHFHTKSPRSSPSTVTFCNTTDSTESQPGLEQITSHSLVSSSMAYG